MNFLKYNGCSGANEKEAGQVRWGRLPARGDLGEQPEHQGLGVGLQEQCRQQQPQSRHRQQGRPRRQLGTCSPLTSVRANLSRIHLLLLLHSQITSCTLKKHQYCEEHGLSISCCGGAR